MIIMILCNKLLLGRATSQLASCTEPSRAGSLFSRATKTGSARARSERRAGPSRAELLRARTSSSSSSFFPGERILCSWTSCAHMSTLNLVPSFLIQVRKFLLCATLDHPCCVASPISSVCHCCPYPLNEK
jgi:hypothetical protein